MKMSSGMVIASPQLMMMWLKHITASRLGEPEAGTEYLVFRSGAKLIYYGKNRWAIKAYATGTRDFDKSDWRAAMAELRAAFYLHQAESQLIKVDAEMQVTPRFARTYCGMAATYSDGSPSSSRS